MQSMLRTGSYHRRRSGFTLVEVLVVVVILAVLAAIVIPQFVSATNESRESSIRMNLHRIRVQLEVYRTHHGDFPTLAEFVDQMTLASNSDGETAAIGTAGYPFGPYVREIPTNAKNDLNTVADTAAGTSGWYYDEDTGEFFANDSAESRAF